jgi:ferric-dicitrate binding protein FerR (iron transport regulator)
MLGPAWRVAASVALLIGLVWLVKVSFFSMENRQVIAAGDRQREVMLPDSSRIWLNRGSTLAYVPGFNGPTRVVELVGEGFFEVRRDPQRPFIIQAAGARAEVLGTSFNLRAYPQEDQVVLVVETGKVAFSAREGKAEIIITPGFAGSLSKQSSTFKKQSVRDANAWAWKSGQLKFDAKPLGEVLPEVERYFGIMFRLQHPGLTTCRFTGSFQDPELTQMLQVLEASLQIEIKKQPDQTLLITGLGCSEQI